MNGFRFGNFIKRTLIMLVLFFMISGQATVFARAGGGGSSGGGGGSSSSSGGSHGSSSGGRYHGGASYPVTDAIFIGIIVVIAMSETIAYKVKINKKKSKSIKAIKGLSRRDYNWNYDGIKKNVEEAFYKVQLAWAERNQDLAKEYMSEKLYNQHKKQTDRMILRKKKNILKNMTLIREKPIGLNDYDGIDRDVLWVDIQARAIDYTINDETKKVIQGQDNKAVYFEEYWKFIRTETRWVLDEIKQKNEVGDLDFFEVKIDK